METKVGYNTSIDVRYMGKKWSLGLQPWLLTFLRRAVASVATEAIGLALEEDTQEIDVVGL